MNPRIVDLTGKRFGRWTAIGLVDGRTTKIGGIYVAVWSVRCDCGATGSVRSATLITGGSRSCGCLRYGALADRFWAKVNKNGPIVRPALGPCWLWTGRMSGDRGRMSVAGREEGAPRIAFFLADGRWPDPWALHHCDNPHCVRRSHLFEGTRIDNILDMVAKGRGALGERNASARLTEHDVRAIRGASGVRHADLAARFGVSRALVGQILQRKIWKHVEETT